MDDTSTRQIGPNLTHDPKTAPTRREITTHHDGHGLAESIAVIADAPGPGGASHRYLFVARADEAHRGSIPGRGSFGWEYPAGYVQFQKGPRHEADSTPGVIESVLLAVLIDRLEAFQAGPYACAENVTVLFHLHAAMGTVKQRAHNRAARGVLGTATP
jgi:hypothetical protein